MLPGVRHASKRRFVLVSPSNCQDKAERQPLILPMLLFLGDKVHTTETGRVSLLAVSLCFTVTDLGALATAPTTAAHTLFAHTV